MPPRVNIKELEKRRKQTKEERGKIQAKLSSAEPFGTKQGEPVSVTEEGGVFVSKEAGQPSGISLPEGRTFFGLNPENVASIARQELPPDAELPFFKQQPLGSNLLAVERFKQEQSQPLLSNLESDILEQPSLKPETLPFSSQARKVAELGLLPATLGGNIMTTLAEKITGKKFGRTTADELANTAAGRALGAATTGVGVALAAAAVAPYIAALAAKSSITSSIIGKAGSVPLLKEAILGLGIYVVGKSVFDIRGDEMENLRTQLQKVVEDGERIEAAVKNGFPNSDSIQLLSTMVDEVAYAESRLKELGNNNLQYRVSKEYILDQQRVRSAREALLRRVLAVQNIAETGQSAFDPEALMYTASRFEEEAKAGGF